MLFKIPPLFLGEKRVSYILYMIRYIIQRISELSVHEIQFRHLHTNFSDSALRKYPYFSSRSGKFVPKPRCASTWQICQFNPFDAFSDFFQRRWKNFLSSYSLFFIMFFNMKKEEILIDSYFVYWEKNYGRLVFSTLKSYDEN